MGVPEEYEGICWDEMVERLLKLFEEDNVNIEDVQDVLEAYRSCQQDWAKYAKFDKYRYTRNLVHEGNGKFNLMLLCWAEGNLSTIHDHANAHCFVKVLDGGLREVSLASARMQFPSLRFG
jgi:cysteine dioxygenase